MRKLLQRWFGLRCVIHMCPGTIITPHPGGTYWQCSRCPKQAR